VPGAVDVLKADALRGEPGFWGAARDLSWLIDSDDQIADPRTVPELQVAQVFVGVAGCVLLSVGESEAYAVLFGGELLVGRRPEERRIRSAPDPAVAAKRSRTAGVVLGYRRRRQGHAGRGGRRGDLQRTGGRGRTWISRRGVVITCPDCGAAPPGAKFCPACGARLTPMGPGATERKVVTTLFADIVGFTALGERHDPEDVDGALHAFCEAARAAVERFGGVVEKFIGDAVVGAFGVPAAHEDDAERGVRAGLAIIEVMAGLPPLGDERLRVRVGVNTGLALVRLNVPPTSGEGFFVGDAVNTTARLLTAAPPMSVVVGEKTHALSARAIDYERLPAVQAKGKARPVKAWLTRGPIARRGVDLADADGASMVGRELELGLLSGLFDRAIASRSPQFALIVGEAGIGKSRLASEFAEVLDQRPGGMYAWRQGRCPPYGDGLTFWALGEIVKAHAGVLETDDHLTVEKKLVTACSADRENEQLVARLRPLVGLDSSPASREDNFSAWLAFLEQIARARPCVVVFEDVHWASDTTLDFLEYAMDHGQNAALLIIATARPEFLDHHPEVAERPDRMVVLDLRALTPADSSRLTSALLPTSDQAQVETIVDRSGGNPLYIRELVRYLDEQAEHHGDTPSVAGGEPAIFPDSLHTLIAARLDALPEEHKAALADAAVVGHVFWPSTLAAIRGTSPGSVDAVLDQLSARQFVRESSESTFAGERELAFSHALIRDVAYDALPRAERARKHAAVAQWLASQARGREQDVAEILAHHYATSLDLAQAARETELAAHIGRPTIDALARAGDSALALDVRAAERHYARALAFASADDPARPRILAGQAQALAQSGSLDAAVETFTEAIDGLRALGDTRAASVAMTELSRVLVELSDPGAIELSDAALSAIAEEDPSPELVRILEQRAYLYLTEGDSASALDAANRALSIGHGLGLPESSRALMQRGVALCDAGDPALALGDLQRSLAVAQQGGVAAEVSAAYACLAEAVLVFRGPHEALAIHREGIATARSRHDEIGEGFLRAGEFENLVVLGRWDTAIGAYDDLETWLSHRHQTFSLWGTRRRIAIVLALRGGDSVRAAVHELEVGDRNAARGGHRLELMAGAVVYHAAGDDVRASRDLERFAACAAALGDQLTLVFWWPLVLRTALRAAPDLVGRMMEAKPPAIDAVPPSSAAVAGLLSEHRGDHEKAASEFALAAAHWRELDVPLEEAEARFGLGRCLAATGQSEAAAGSLRAAYEIFARLGAGSAMAEVAAAVELSESSNGGSARLR